MQYLNGEFFSRSDLRSADLIGNFTGISVQSEKPTPSPGCTLFPLFFHRFIFLLRCIMLEGNNVGSGPTLLGRGTNENLSIVPRNNFEVNKLLLERFEGRNFIYELL